MLLALVFGFSTVFASTTAERMPAHVQIACEHLVGDGDSTSETTTSFELNSEGQGSHLFQPLFAPDKAGLLFSLVENGQFFTRVDGRKAFRGTAYVLVVTRVSNPRERMITTAIPRDGGPITYELAQDALAAGKLNGTTSTWIEIDADVDGTVSASVIHENTRLDAKDGVLNLDLRYAMKTDRPQLDPSGWFFFGLPLESVVNPVRRTFTTLANKTLGIGYQVDFRIKLKMKFSNDGKPAVVADVTSVT